MLPLRFSMPYSLPRMMPLLLSVPLVTLTEIAGVALPMMTPLLTRKFPLPVQLIQLVLPIIVAVPLTDAEHDA